MICRIFNDSAKLLNKNFRKKNKDKKGTISIKKDCAFAYDLCNYAIILRSSLL